MTALMRTPCATVAPPQTLADIASDVESGVSSCTMCKDWKLPRPQNIATPTLADSFNEEDLDILFVLVLLMPAQG